jgi:hypothetical protein
VRVPRALGCMSLVDAKQKQPTKKQAIETRDFTQPSRWLVGWPDAPSARKIVLPVEDVSLCRGKWGVVRTRLHGDEAIPGIVRAAVAEPGDETACYDGYVCMLGGDFILEVTRCGPPTASARLEVGSVGSSMILRCWQCGLSGIWQSFGSSFRHDSCWRESIVKTRETYR